MKCKVDGCDNKSRSHGVCIACYHRKRRNGDFERVKPARDRSLDEAIRSYNNYGISLREISEATGLSRHCCRMATIFK